MKEPVLRRLGAWGRAHRTELLLTALAFAVRLVYVLCFPQQAFHGDETYYLDLADHIRGVPVTSDVSPYYPLLYPWFLATIRTVFGTGIAWIRVFQATASALTVFVMMRLADRAAGRRAMIVAGWLGALSAPMMLESGMIYSETLYALMLTLAVWTFVRTAESARGMRMLLVGAAFALAGMVRELGFYGGLILAGVYGAFKRSWQLALQFSAPIILAMALIAARNAWASRTAPVTTPVPLLAKRYETVLVEHDFYHYLSLPSHWPMLPIGLWHFLAFPHRLVVISSGVNIKAALFSGRLSRMAPVWQELLAKTTLMLLQLATVIAAGYGLVRARALKSLKIATIVLVAFAGGSIIIRATGYWSGLLAFEPLSRYRFPVDPLLMVMAGIGLDAWLTKRTARKEPRHES